MINENSHPMVSEVHQTHPNSKIHMLRVTTHKKSGKVLLTIEGRLAGELPGEASAEEVLALAVASIDGAATGASRR